MCASEVGQGVSLPPLPFPPSAPLEPSKGRAAAPRAGLGYPAPGRGPAWAGARCPAAPCLGPQGRVGAAGGGCRLPSRCDGDGPGCLAASCLHRAESLGEAGARAGARTGSAPLPGGARGWGRLDCTHRLVRPCSAAYVVAGSHPCLLVVAVGVSLRSACPACAPLSRPTARVWRLDGPCAASRRMNDGLWDTCPHSIRPIRLCVPERPSSSTNRTAHPSP